MAKQNITYLLGAGASANALPVVGEFKFFVQNSTLVPGATTDSTISRIYLTPPSNSS